MIDHSSFSQHTLPSLVARFDELINSLPQDWTNLQLDLRLASEQQYIEAATFLTVVNAQPYSKHSWHFRLLIANRFGHAAAVPAVRAAFAMLDKARIEAEFLVREVRSGRVEVRSTWGQPYSAREAFRELNAQ